MEIETPRLVLRDYRIEDWSRVHLYTQRPEFSEFEMWGPNSEADSQKFAEDMALQASEGEGRHKFDLAICLKSTHLLIGGCGIRREAQESRIANLGWAIHPDLQGNGYATEAASALIRFGFDALELALIYATCDSRNTASFRVMEKLKMKTEESNALPLHPHP